MSTINKKPFIKSLLESLSAEDLQTLSELIDGGGNQVPLQRTANPIATENCPHIGTDDKGVHLCNLTVNYTGFLGYLIYNDDYCVLISFTDAQVLKMFQISDSGADTVDEAINILELRSALYETKGGSGGGSEIIKACLGQLFKLWAEGEEGIITFTIGEDVTTARQEEWDKTVAIDLWMQEIVAKYANCESETKILPQYPILEKVNKATTSETQLNGDVIIFRVDPTSETSADVYFKMLDDLSTSYLVGLEKEIDAETGDIHMTWGDIYVPGELE